MNFEDHKGIWIYIEEHDGQIAPVSLELLGAGRQLADKRGTDLAGVLIGYQVRHLVDQLLSMGLTASMYTTSPSLTLSDGTLSGRHAGLLSNVQTGSDFIWGHFRRERFGQRCGH